MNFSVTQFGKELSKDKYTLDGQDRIFSTKESNLVLDFSKYEDWIFETGASCTFETGGGNTFITKSGCVFNTGKDCTFKTSYNCNFITGYNCFFETGSGCVFDVGHGCIFKTGKNSVIVRRDTMEVIQPVKGKKIMLNKYSIQGFVHLKETKIIILDGNEIEISEESFEELKKQLLNETLDKEYQPVLV